jgi:glycosyltransferase involved in cell wall biosynthesis
LDRGTDAILEIADFSGPEQDRMEHLIDELDLRDAVTILGTIPPAAVRDALWRSDIFVLPALSEGISNAVVEAMACGVPVITTECGGMREAVTDGIEGRVVPLRDVEQFANAIEQLSKDRDLRIRMGDAGRARAVRQFGGELQARQFLTMYEDAAQSYRAAREDAKLEPRREGAQTTDGLSTHSPMNGRDASWERQNPVRIITIAELHWRNGHEYALEAMRLLQDRRFPFKYTIVGNGPFLEAVGFARYQLGLMEDVKLILDADRAEKELKEADLFLLASVAGGAESGLSTAIARGLPIVCTEIVSSLCAPAGRLERRVVTRRDPKAIADAILEIGSSTRVAEHGDSCSSVTLV